MMPMRVAAEDVFAAAGRIRGHVVRTPCHLSMALSRLCGCEVWAKLDYLQHTGSFKERGARNKLSRLAEAGGEAGGGAGGEVAGVVAASAGNHAQALAYHGRQLGLGVTVVMPRFAPLVKVANTRGHGAEVVLHGESFDEARRHALDLAAQRGLTYVHGFDDPDVVAGAGTAGLEVLEDVPDADAIVVPVGGGGLVAGVSAWTSHARPACRVIAVEAESAPTLSAAMEAGGPVDVPTRPSIADGLAITRVGACCFETLRGRVDRVVLVDEAQTARAVLALLELEKAVVEGAAATTLAALAGPLRDELAGKKVVLMLCGGNIDATVLGRVIERGLAADGRLCRVTCRVSDRPGTLAGLLDVLGRTGASVKEVSHDRSFGSADVGLVDITVTLETHDRSHVKAVQAALAGARIEVVKCQW